MKVGISMNELKQIISNGRELKGFSQRKLAKKIGVHHSTLNDIENGQIKKVSIDMLRLISEELDLSLIELLAAAGYSEFALSFDDYYAYKTADELKAKLAEYRKSELDMLDDMFKKRTNVRNQASQLYRLKDRLEFGESEVSAKEIIDILDDVTKGLKPSIRKYDYSKLPQKD